MARASALIRTAITLVRYDTLIARLTGRLISFTSEIRRTARPDPDASTVALAVIPGDDPLPSEANTVQYNKVAEVLSRRSIEINGRQPPVRTGRALYFHTIIIRGREMMTGCPLNYLSEAAQHLSLSLALFLAFLDVEIRYERGYRAAAA